jgi:hypothetical protein
MTQGGYGYSQILLAGVRNIRQSAWAWSVWGIEMPVRIEKDDEISSDDIGA